MMRRRVYIPVKRKRLGKTDYRLRLRLLQGGKPRLVVRKSLRNVLVQLVVYDLKGDRIAASAHARELRKFGWVGARRNTPVAYLVGFLAGRRALAKQVREAVADLGLQKAVRGSVMFAAVKGALDAGLAVRHGEGVFPPEERIRGKHLKQSAFEQVLATMKAAKV